MRTKLLLPSLKNAIDKNSTIGWLMRLYGIVGGAISFMKSSQLRRSSQTIGVLLMFYGFSRRNNLATVQLNGPLNGSLSLTKERPNSNSRSMTGSIVCDTCVLSN